MPAISFFDSLGFYHSSGALPVGADYLERQGGQGREREGGQGRERQGGQGRERQGGQGRERQGGQGRERQGRSEEHTSELQSP